MKNHLIMLDLDGTLLDTSALYLEGVPSIINAHLGIQIQPEAILPLWGRHARLFFGHFAEQAGRADQALVDTMYAEFERYYNQVHNTLSKPYAGVSTHLPRFRKAGYHTVVVTTRPSSRSGPVLELPLCQWIDRFVWGDMVRRSKPAPDGLTYALNHFGAQKGVYVGDNPHDISAAKACPYSVHSVAALWGAMTKERLLKTAPDQAFTAFADFVDWALTLD